MQKYYFIPRTGIPAKGPMSAQQVLDLVDQTMDKSQMLVWWEEQKEWTKVTVCISQLRAQAVKDSSALSPEPAIHFVTPEDKISVGQIRVSRDGKKLGEFHEADIPALLRAKVLQPTDTYLAAGMTKPSPLSELLLALLLKPAAQPASPPVIPIASGQHHSPVSTQLQSAGASQPHQPRGKCCPRCHSEDIRTFEMIYKSGSSNSNTIGITLSGELGQARTRSMSDLASEVAPPDMSGPGCFSIVMATAFGLIIGMAVNPTGAGPIVGAILGLVIRMGIYLVGASDRDAQYETWKKSWMCMKCGHKFVG
jgi:hypothetical protein